MTNPTSNQRLECNACDWKGPRSEAVHFKHDASVLLCPECKETTMQSAPLAPNQQVVAQLENVARWLENKCDPFHAARELRLIVEPMRSDETSGQRAPMHVAGERFVQKFKREPASASDAAWLNGFVEACSPLEPRETPRDDAAFEAGWRASAEWAKRDDLVHDIDSFAYRIERFNRLERLAVEPRETSPDEELRKRATRLIVAMRRDRWEGHDHGYTNDLAALLNVGSPVEPFGKHPGAGDEA